MRATRIGALLRLALALFSVCAIATARAEPSSGLASSAGAAYKPGPEWKDPAAMRAYLKKAGPSDRLELYRFWLAMSVVERPTASEELGAALASDLPSMESAKAREMADSLSAAMERRRGFWPDSGEARGRLVGAMLDRPEPAVIKQALHCVVAAASGLALTKQRASRILALLGEGGYALPDPEARSLWALAWSTMAKGADTSAARAVAARVAETRGYSLWSLASRLPALSADGVAAAFSEARMQPSESRLLLAMVASVDIGSEGAISLGRRLPDSAALKRLYDARAKAGDSAFIDLLTLTEKEGSPKVADIAAIEAMGDWAAGIALLRASRRGGAIPPEADLIALLDASRPTQATAAASLLAGSASAEAVNALSSLLRNGSVRDPALLVTAQRVLAGAAGPECLDLVAALCSAPAAEVRASACGSLARIGDARAAPFLLARVRDGDTAVRLAAIEGLGELRDPRAVEPLAASLLDPREEGEIRGASARALKKLGDARTLRPFVDLLLAPRPGDSSDEVARIYAAMSLGEGREKAAVECLLKNIDPTREADLNYHCIVALGRIADPAGLLGLLPIVMKGLPAWSASIGSRSAAAAYWALLPLEPGVGRQLYRERWEASGGAKAKADASLWYAALYLFGNSGLEAAAAEREGWESHLNAGLAAAIDADCAMAGEALDRYPVPSVALRASALLRSLDPYAKTWIAAALIHHPAPAMIPAFRELLDCDDDFLVYAGLASVDRLIPELGGSLRPELRVLLADFRARLSTLSESQLEGGTKAWRDVVLKRLDLLLDD